MAEQITMVTRANFAPIIFAEKGRKIDTNPLNCIVGTLDAIEKDVKMTVCLQWGLIPVKTTKHTKSQFHVFPTAPRRDSSPGALHYAHGDLAVGEDGEAPGPD